jgi:hypothetical protein
MDVGAHPEVVEHLPGEAVRQREALEDQRQHPRDVGVGLVDRRTRLEAGDSLVAEVADEDLRAIELEGQDDLRRAVEELEAGGQHADDLTRCSVDHERPAEDSGIGAELPLPVPVRQDYPSGTSRGIVFLREATAEDRLHAEDAEQAV